MEPLSSSILVLGEGYRETTVHKVVYLFGPFDPWMASSQMGNSNHVLTSHNLKLENKMNGTFNHLLFCFGVGEGCRETTVHKVVYLFWTFRSLDGLLTNGNSNHVLTSQI